MKIKVHLPRMAALKKRISAKPVASISVTKVSIPKVKGLPKLKP